MENFCHTVFKNKNKIASMRFLSMLQNADYNFYASGSNVQPYNYSDVLEALNIEINNINHSEQARYNKVKFNDDFIQYAHIKHNT